MKKVLVFIALLILIALLSLWFLKTEATSWFLSKKLKTSISLGGVDLSKSKINLQNFKIHNPSGYKHEFAYVCKEAIVSYKFDEIKKDPSVIDRIDLNDSQLYIDCKNALCTSNNWTEIMKEVADKEVKIQKDGKEVIVNNLAMNGLHVEIHGLGLVPGIKKNVEIDHIDFGKVTSKEGFPTNVLIAEIFKQAGLVEYIKSFLNPTKIFDNLKSLNPFGLNEEAQTENKETSELEIKPVEEKAVESL